MTLRDLAGLPTDPTPLAESTLLVIDAQIAYSRAGMLPLADIDAALVRLGELLEAARHRDVPVIHVAHTGARGTPFNPDDGGRFLADAIPAVGEDIVNKKLPNAFAGTNLRRRVEQLGRPLVICGFMTHMCVASTARAALDLGLHTSVVSDATATRSLQSPITGESITASAMHSAALAALADRFSVVAPTSAFIATCSPIEQPHDVSVA